MKMLSNEEVQSVEQKRIEALKSEIAELEQQLSERTKSFNNEIERMQEIKRDSLALILEENARLDAKISEKRSELVQMDEQFRIAAAELIKREKKCYEDEMRNKEASEKIKKLEIEVDTKERRTNGQEFVLSIKNKMLSEKEENLNLFYQDLLKEKERIEKLGNQKLSEVKTAAEFTTLSINDMLEKEKELANREKVLHNRDEDLKQKEKQLQIATKKIEAQRKQLENIKKLWQTKYPNMETTTTM